MCKWTIETELSAPLSQAGGPWSPRRCGVSGMLGAARGAARDLARAAHHRHDEVPYLHARHTGTDLDHLTERLMADHELVRTRRWRAVVEGTDFAVCPANTNVEDANSSLGRRHQCGRSEIDKLYLALGREDGYGLHFSVLLGGPYDPPRVRGAPSMPAPREGGDVRLAACGSSVSSVVWKDGSPVSMRLTRRASIGTGPAPRITRAARVAAVSRPGFTGSS